MFVNTLLLINKVPLGTKCNYLNNIFQKNNTLILLFYQLFQSFF